MVLLQLGLQLFQCAFVFLVVLESLLPDGVGVKRNEVPVGVGGRTMSKRGAATAWGVRGGQGAVFS